MARIKNQETSIERRFVAFPMMFLSSFILAAIVYFLPSLTIKSNGAAVSEQTMLAQLFSEASAKYAAAVEDLFYRRQSVPESDLMAIKDDFSTLHAFAEEFISRNHIYSLSLTLLPKIKQHEQNSAVLIDVNQVIMAEESIGTQFKAFTDCAISVNYSKTASIVLDNLNKCTPYLVQAQNDALTIPEQSTSGCEASKKTHAILSMYSKNHELLTKFYSLSRDQKAIEASAIDVSYKESLARIKELPSWNFCINHYLQETAKTLGLE